MAMVMGGMVVGGVVYCFGFIDGCFVVGGERGAFVFRLVFF